MSSSLTDSSIHMPQLLQEFSECDKLSYNAIVHVLVEFSATLPSTRISGDIKLLSEAIQLLSVPLPSNSKLFIVGRINDENSRSLKITFTSKELAADLL